MRRLICALLGHAWTDWIRVEETMTLLSECRRCSEARTVRYERQVVPDAFVEDVLRQFGTANPYRDMFRHE